MKYKILIIFIVISILVSSITVFGYFLLSNEKDIVSHRENTTVNDSRINIEKIKNKAKIYYYQGNLKKSLKLYQKILKNDKNNMTALKNLYFLNKEAGDYDKAFEYIQNIRKIKPNNIYWQYKYGILLYQVSKYEKAYTLLDNLLQKINNPENNVHVDGSNKNFINNKEMAIFYYYLGNSAYQMEKKDISKEYLKKGIEEAPHRPINYYSLAEIYKEEENLEKAIYYYQQTLKKDSSFSIIYPELALLYQRTGDEKTAYKYWEKSNNTGNNIERAQKEIERILNKYPDLKQQELDEKEKQRKKIRWIKVNPVKNDENIPELRIGLVNNAKKINFQTGTSFSIKREKETIFEGKAKNEYSINYQNGVYKILENKNIIKEFSIKTPIKIILDNKINTTAIYDIKYGHGYFWADTEDRQYRGIIEVYPVSKDSFNIINIINMEEYLFSVVPAEIPAWWPKEALKTQSIAARSYALANINRHKQEGYNLCDSVHCAAYNGVKWEHKNTTNAVLATRGEVGQFKGNNIDAVFSSNSGGYSESSAEIWGVEHSYLSGTNNMINYDYSFPLEPYMLEKWLMSEPESYANIHKYSGYNNYRWVKIIDDKYLEKKYNLENLEE
ncbi:MAG: SpoIID/LytB domain-containing protein, partial [Halanaerobiales bacterium]